MAERALVAFGRYVKILRERRSLSLDDAAALTRVYPSPLNKSYVSRVERGLTRVGFEKMIAIARAYDVPVDVLAERLWLDLELDTAGPPETSGMSILELNDRGINAAGRGRRWAVYACFRDATALAAGAPLESRFRNHGDQVAFFAANLGSAAMRLGAFKYARAEMEYARSVAGPDSPLDSMISTHLSSLSRRIGDLVAARSFSEEAVALATTNNRTTHLGFALVSRGMVAHAEKDIASAIEFYQRAIRAFRELGYEAEHANALSNVAQAYFDLGRMQAARRAIASAERVALRHGVDHVRVRARILLGEIEELSTRHGEALRLWRDAADIARQIRDRTLLFKADFLIFRRAVLDEDLDTARAIARKLRRLAPWVLSDIPELADFRQMSKGRDYSRRQRPRVSG